MPESQQPSLQEQAPDRTTKPEVIICPPTEEIMEEFVNRVCEHLCEGQSQVIEIRQGFGNFFRVVVKAMVNHANRKEAT